MHIKRYKRIQNDIKNSKRLNLLIFYIFYILLDTCFSFYAT